MKNSQDLILKAAISGKSEPMNEAQTEVVTLAVAIGYEVAQLLNLKFNQPQARTKTEWGTKSVEGLGNCISRIVEEQTRRIKGEEQKPSFIKKVWSDDTGGGVMVDYVELTNGKVIGLTDEVATAYANAEEVEAGEAYASMPLASPLKNINVHVRGGVAYCDSPQVEIIDHDNLAETVSPMQDLLDTNGLNHLTVLDSDNVSMPVNEKERIFNRNTYGGELDANNRAELYVARELDRAFELIDEVANFASEADEKAYEDFIEKYKPIENPIGENVPFDGFMFETYGEELDFVQKRYEKAPGTVWTILDGEKGSYLASGYHFVNRLGYMVTENPYIGAELLEIKL